MNKAIEDFMVFGVGYVFGLLIGGYLGHGMSASSARMIKVGLNEGPENPERDGVFTHQ